MNYKNILLFLLFLLLGILAFIPRGTESFNKNYVFGFDQGRDYLDVKDIVDGHKLTLIGPEIGAGAAGFQYIFHGPGFYYLLSLAYILFHGDPYGGVVFMFLFGLASIGIAFYVGRKILGLWGGYIFALLIVISPPLIDQSRFVWDSYPSTFFIILFLYFLYLSIKKSFPFIFLAAFTAAFIYNFELAIAAPLVVGTIFFYTVIQKEKKLSSYLSLFGGLFLGFLPMVLFETRHGFLGLRGIFTYLFSSHTQTHSPSLVTFLPDHLNSFRYNFINAFPHIDFPLLYVVLFLIILSSIYFLRKEKSVQIKKLLSLLLCLPFISFFILSFLKNAVWQHYLYHLIVVYLFLFSYVFITSLKKKIKILYIGMLLILSLLTLRGIMYANRVFNQSFLDYYGGTARIKGKMDAIDYIYKDAKGQKFSLFIFAPPIYTYPYDYILQWHAKKKYGYLPSQEKKGLFYLLIEKDYSQPWTYEGWMKTVIKTGEVKETKTLDPSKFIIQKRYGLE